MKRILAYSILLLMISFGLTSCNNDDDNSNNDDTTHELVGVWLRIDSNETFEERFTFNADQTGNNFFRDGTFTNSSDFTWDTEDNFVTVITENGDGNFATSYSFNSSGQLVLFADGALTYNKI